MLDNPISRTIVSSQCIKVLHARPEVWKVLVKKKTLEDTGMEKVILKQTPLSQVIISRTNKWDCMMLKNIFKQQNTQVKRQTTK